MNDDRLTTGVRELLKMRRIPGLEVDAVWAEQGIIHVRGAASSEFARRACHECCRRVTGVRGVISDVRLIS